MFKTILEWARAIRAELSAPTCYCGTTAHAQIIRNGRAVPACRAHAVGSSVRPL